MNLARAIGLAALLTTATPAFADASGYSTLEPAVADPDVVITGIIGRKTHQPGRKAESRHWYGNNTTCFVCSSLPETASTWRL
ncbi:hypothetical protein [Rhodovibrio sodomensis]|uniref:hypothetical protein n=1 Tax=Rhodovibrio sodomensis TaxID=1088 RepID=UPI001904BFDD|nr:hypothetical protein [Rhodovibrio sodomensis]